MAATPQRTPAPMQPPFFVVCVHTLENEGVAAYFPKVGTCCNTSLLSENSSVGGDFPHPKISRNRA